MSWADDLLPASFNGVQFEVVSTNDSIERAKVIHQYPYVDGADVLDMGAGAPPVLMTAVFYGDQYETELQTFLTAVNIPDTCELIHPVFGSMQVQFLRTSIPHGAQEPDYTKITLDFIRVGIKTPLFDRVLPAQQVDAVNSSADDTLDTAQAQLLSDFTFAVSLPALVLSKLSADMLNVIAHMNTYCNQLSQITGWVASEVNYLADPTAFFDDVASGLVSRVQAIFAPMNLQQAYSGTSGAPGSSSVTSLIDGASGVVASGTAVATSSATFSGMNYIATPAVGYTQGSLATVWTAPMANLLQPLLTLSPPATSTVPTGPFIVSSMASASVNGVTSTQPFLVAHIALQQTAAVASAAAQVFSMALSEPVLTPDDIEVITNDVRDNINATIVLVRATWPSIVDHRPITEPLKALALSVYKSAEQLIKEKPPFITRTVTTPGNLNLIAFFWYGDYTRADELLRLNSQITNPNFIPAGIVLSCYAQ